jgi:hypothetical protein
MPFPSHEYQWNWKRPVFSANVQNGLSIWFLYKPVHLLVFLNEDLAVVLVIDRVVSGDHFFAPAQHLLDIRFISSLHGRKQGLARFL